MLARFRVCVVMLGMLAVVGCSGSAKPDPWAEYATAQQVWEHEFRQWERMHDIIRTDPTEENKSKLQLMQEDLDIAASHLKEVRTKLRKSR